MLDILKIVRYVVFVVFVICNAVITSVAVWNLSIIQSIALDSTSKQVDAFLIFVGVSGLILVFPILFIELFGRDTFLSKVWFELSWVGLFWVLELVSAATITSQSNSQLCEDVLDSLAQNLGHDSPCTSAQVLQAFTWICAIMLFGYLSLLSLSSILRYRTDSGIFHCSARKFPWLGGGRRQLNSTPESPSNDKFHEDIAPPRIVAPKPRRLTIPFGEAFASSNHHRGISQERNLEAFRFPSQQYGRPDDEESAGIFQPTARPPAALLASPSSPWGAEPEIAEVERPSTVAGRLRSGLSAYLPGASGPSRQSSGVPRSLAPAALAGTTSLYPTYVQSAAAGRQPIAVLGTPSASLDSVPRVLAPSRTVVAAPPPVITVLPSAKPPQLASPPAPASPSPLGDWPRLDAVARPVAKVKRKPLPSKPAPIAEAQPPPPTSYAFDPAALSAALEPFASSSSNQPASAAVVVSPNQGGSRLHSRPTGPRIRSSSGDAQVLLQPQRRPPNLNLSSISNHRSSNMS